MRLILLILFIAMPLLEIAVFIQMGQAIGIWMTILIVIATAVIGTTVLHAQGFAVWQRFGETMRQGAPPIEPVTEGVLLLIAGALLLTPGLITDAVGAILLVPPLRQLIARWGINRLLGRGIFTVHHSTNAHEPPPNEPPESHRSETIIEGEFTRVDEQTINPNASRRR